MEVFYYVVFGALAAVVAGLELGKSGKDRVATTSAFNSFKNNYVLVYSLMMSGDWLQGPYVYYLYSQYGFDKGDIGRLFIAGFGSSMLFGTIVGSLADKQGRKRACVTYCISYILSCITKHSPEYRVLMIGRILGGIATSLLFSAFESWLVAEHNKRGFDPQWLSITFSKAIFLGNGLIAIVSGLFANLLAENLGFGPVAPFDAAACFLAIGMAIIMSSWSENYGDPSESKDLMAQFKVAAKAIASDEKIALLGAIQSLFEGSMYTFVFLWTPALSPNEEDIPHGFIFATFMLSSMLGSSIASRLLARKLKVEGYMQIVFSISAVTLVLPVATNILVPTSSVKGGSLSIGGSLQLLGFCTFEACVGIFWPSIMKMRSQYIPEEARSTIMNFFRIPLNLFVCVALYILGAGTSLLGLVAAKVGADVTLTDIAQNAEVLNNIRSICALNDANCTVSGLTWGDWDESVFDLRPDIILGADVLYDSGNFDDLFATVTFLLENSSGAVFITTYHNRSGHHLIEFLMVKWGLKCLKLLDGFSFLPPCKAALLQGNIQLVEIALDKEKYK